jgi:hypothetical protein
VRFSGNGNGCVFVFFFFLTCITVMGVHLIFSLFFFLVGRNICSKFMVTVIDAFYEMGI